LANDGPDVWNNDQKPMSVSGLEAGPYLVERWSGMQRQAIVRVLIQ
jgi:hypothetical protein